MCKFESFIFQRPRNPKQKHPEQKKITMIRTGLVLLFLTNYLVLLAQKEIDLAAYQAKYKNDLGVVLNHTQTVKISVNKKTGELDIFETDHEEILYLKNSARFYTEESISLSEFFESII